MDLLKNLCLFACRQTACEEKLCCKRGSDGSIEITTRSEAQLEQVISMKNITPEELNAFGGNFSSAKSLNCRELENSQGKKQSSTSLYNPTAARPKHKLHKVASAVDYEHQQIPTDSESDGIHLVSIKKFVSESVIRTENVGSLHHQNSEIIVENKLLKQLSQTDNNEMEDLHEKCDREP